MRDWKKIRSVLLQRSDVVLAALVGTIIVLMIFRLSQATIDALIAINIATSVIILFVSLFAREAVKLSSLPTVILLTTLFRLGLNLASTKLILIDRNAGEIIQAFGNVVVDGDYVVGTVVYVVLVLVQFLVIAKGAERSSDVSARFALDMVPGKQLAIDSDVAKGQCDEATARKRRLAIERESKFFGSMEGAMKFVKGDAIVGIMISVINVVGGLIVGSQKGLDLSTCAKEFTILAIGDGLVSQIPSLLNCVAAGIIVTRVGENDAEKKSNVADEILKQFIDDPTGLLVASLILLGLALFGPSVGLPWAPFSALAGVALVAAVLRIRVQRHEARVAAGKSTDDPRKALATTKPRNVSGHTLRIELSEELRSAITSLWDTERMKTEIPKALTAILDRVADKTGVGFPDPDFGFNDALLPGEYVIVVNGGVVGSGTVTYGQTFIRATPQLLKASGFAFESGFLPSTGEAVGIVADADVKRFEDAGFKSVSALDAVFLHLESCLRQNASDFLGIQEVTERINELKKTCPNLVQCVVPGLFLIQDVTEVMRLLLREQVPIDDLRSILEALARFRSNGEERSPIRNVVSHVRVEMQKIICRHYSDKSQRLRYYLFHSEIESMLLESLGDSELSRADRVAIRTAIANAIGPDDYGDGFVAINVDPKIRWTVVDLLDGTMPGVAVLSRREFAQNVHWVGGKVIVPCAADAAVAAA